MYSFILSFVFMIHFFVGHLYLQVYWITNATQDVMQVQIKAISRWNPECMFWAFFKWVNIISIASMARR